ncbi:MAG TPA: hypothetical protein PKB06_03300, partial [Actinotalea sp.]|nr:hypothetical protein [Actinotalea sp.]
IDGSPPDTVVRKAGYAAATLTSGPIAWITLAVVVALVVLVWPGGRRRPAWYRQTVAQWPIITTLLVGLLVAAVPGSVVNDYGTRIATVLLAMALPMLGQVVLRTAGTNHHPVPADHEEGTTGAPPRPGPATSSH